MPTPAPAAHISDPSTPPTPHRLQAAEQPDLPSPPSTSSLPPPSLLQTLPPPSPHPGSPMANPPPHTPSEFFGPLLLCPACVPPGRLENPTTLHCGHTVCAAHVRDNRPLSGLSPRPTSSASRETEREGEQPRPRPASRPSPSTASTARPAPAPAPAPANAPAPASPVIPTCPLPTCRPIPQRHAAPPIQLPQGSTVRYYPPPITPAPPAILAASATVTVPNPRLDVSVTRVLDLLHKADDWQVHSDHQNIHNDSTHSDTASENEDEEDPSSSSVPRARASSSRDRPHKRRHTEPRERTRFNSHEELDDYFNKELSESLTCEICFMLLYQPITTPCQHTFCAKCLQRSLDHGTTCPLCRQTLPPYSYFQDHPFNKVVLAILLKAFPEMYAERGQAIRDEERNIRLRTPIFVCQLSFPGIPTVLLIFEPKYRLMLRRCVESSTDPQFGMIMPSRTPNSAGNEYGTMLHIQSVQMLPDGRSMVETMGIYRFRILESGTMDGYTVARIERVDDIPEELQELTERNLSVVRQPSSDGAGSSSAPVALRPLEPTTEELKAVCHAFVDQLRNGTAPWVVQRLNNTYGPMPTDTSNFTFWMAQVLPIDEHEKAKLLVIRTARRRLQLVVYWIEQLNSNWWFSNGCTIC